jgi:hypothetical protein
MSKGGRMDGHMIGPEAHRSGGERMTDSLTTADYRLPRTNQSHSLTRDAKTVPDACLLPVSTFAC